MSGKQVPAGGGTNVPRDGDRAEREIRERERGERAGDEASRIGETLEALQRSPFRRRFRLGDKDRAYIARASLPAILDHGRDFIAARLAPAEPPNDGRQTPMRGHPVFVAQHATATCCRGCLAKWHRLPAGRALAAPEQAYVLAVIRTWLERELAEAPPPPPTEPDLFG